MSVQKGQPLTESDLFLVEWAKESKKANLSLANDVLGKFLGTTTAFVGGGVVFLNKTIIPQFLIAPILLLLLLSVALAFIGVLPYQASVNVNSPTEIDKHKSQTNRALNAHNLYKVEQ